MRGLKIPQSPLLKIFVARSGHITYVGSDGNLYVTDQSGSATRLTDDAQHSNGTHTTYVSPTWSPDGTRLAYARYLTDPTTGTSTAQLHVLDWKTGGDVDTFTSKELQPFYFDWSPDGKRIAVLSDRAGKLELGVVRADAADSYRPLDSGSPYYWTWSADGAALISHTDFTARSGGRVSIVPVDTSIRRTDLNGDFSLFQAPSVLPNGEIVAAESRGAASQLVLIPPAGGSPKPIAQPDAGGFLFSVSPNGKLVAYLQTKSVGTQLRSVLHVWDLGADRELHVVDDRSTIAFYWAPNSSMIALLSPAATDKVDGSYSPIPSLPHLTLEVLDVHSGKRWQIATFPPTQGLISTLPYTDQYQHSQTIWSPNSRFVVYTAYTPEGLPGVFVAEADGNITPAKIAAGDYAVWSRR